MSRRRGAGVLCILGATLTLVLLTWAGTVTAIRTQRAGAQARVEANVASQALLFQQLVQNDLLEIDETLRSLAYAWQADPTGFRLRPWTDQLVLLHRISHEVFRADETGIVRDSTIQAALGRDIYSRDLFKALSPPQGSPGDLFIGGSRVGRLTSGLRMDLARRLYQSDGVFAGAIVASLDLDALGGFYRTAALGSRGMIALLRMPAATVQVAVAPRPVAPGSRISGSAMFQAMQAAPDGVWTGPTAFDGIIRVHGFRPIGVGGLAVVVAVDRRDATSVTNGWERAAYVFAGGITLLLLCLAGILTHTLNVARGRERSLAEANQELAQAKARADDERSRLEATLAGMSDGVAMIDARQKLVLWNDRFAAVSGVPAEILHPGLPMEDILRAQAARGEFGVVDIEIEVARRLALLHVGNVADVSERVRPDGRIIELRRNTLPDGGFVTLYADVTARKQAENALREARSLAEAGARAMSRFVAVVSHEIRTPLNALLNTLALLADNGLPATERPLLDTARRWGDALAALINDILEMSRMEAGQFTLRPSVFALRPLLESAIEMFTAQAAERRIALRLSLAPDVPEELFDDPGRLRQVLINLLSNAVKFAAAGEVRVLVETKYAAGASLVRIAVRDRGPVIAEEGRARLFQPFSRLGEAAEGVPLGSGLGLTICRQLVGLMGGEIGCSVWTIGGHDAGNEFWVTLPLKRRPPDPYAPLGQALERPILPRTRLLLVEDIAANQIVTANLLRREGHSVDIVGSGELALVAVVSRPYDLVFMDIFLPGLSGLDVTRRIRAMTGPAARMPIIALTANVCPEDQALCAAAGMNGMLGKPVALNDLLETLCRHVWPHRPPCGRHSGGTEVPPYRVEAPMAISPSRLASLRAVLPVSRLAAMIEECLVEMAERLRAFQAALDDGGTSVLTHAHALAGMAAEYGMVALEARCRALMHGVSGSEMPPIAVVDELAGEMARAAGALRAALRTETIQRTGDNSGLVNHHAQ